MRLGSPQSNLKDMALVAQFDQPQNGGQVAHDVQGAEAGSAPESCQATWQDEGESAPPCHSPSEVL